MLGYLLQQWPTKSRDSGRIDGHPQAFCHSLQDVFCVIARVLFRKNKFTSNIFS